MTRIGKSLDNSVIGDRYGFVSPLERTLYDILALGYSVHITHLGMAMELDSLSFRFIRTRCPEVIDPDDALYILHVQIAVIELSAAYLKKSRNPYECSGFEFFLYRGRFRGIDVHLAAYRIGKVRDVKGNHGSFVLDGNCFI